jgi:hypothetical protein
VAEGIRNEDRQPNTFCLEVPLLRDHQTVIKPEDNLLLVGVSISRHIISLLSQSHAILGKIITLQSATNPLVAIKKSLHAT